MNQTTSKRQRWDETIDESFPASDPPANTVRQEWRGPPDETLVRDNQAESRFELEKNGETAFLNYERTPTSMIFLHTEVPPTLRGHLCRGTLWLKGRWQQLAKKNCELSQRANLYWPICKNIRKKATRTEIALAPAFGANLTLSVSVDHTANARTNLVRNSRVLRWLAFPQHPGVYPRRRCRPLAAASPAYLETPALALSDDSLRKRPLRPGLR